MNEEMLLNLLGAAVWNGAWNFSQGMLWRHESGSRAVYRLDRQYRILKEDKLGKRL